MPIIAQVELVATQADRLALNALISGRVLAQAVELGETAMPGVPVHILGDLYRVKVTVFVPEPRLGQVWLGPARARNGG